MSVLTDLYLSKHIYLDVHYSVCRKRRKCILLDRRLTIGPEPEVRLKTVCRRPQVSCYLSSSLRKSFYFNEGYIKFSMNHNAIILMLFYTLVPSKWTNFFSFKL